jgi:signal transduction histidine kinase
LLRSIARLIKEKLGYYLVGIGLIEEDELAFRAGAGAVWEVDDFQPPRIHVGQEGITGWVAQSGEPLLVPDVSKEPRYYGLPQAKEMRAELAVPLKAKGTVIGVLHVQSDRLDAFDEGDQAVLVSLAHQAASAIENARLYTQAQQVATLEERQRLARDLHDSATQSLYSVTLLAETSRQATIAGDVEVAADCLSQLGEAARQALKEMRLLVYELRPPVLEQVGLVGALQQRLDAVEGRAGIETRFLVEHEVELAAPVEEALYRIALEAMNNSLKHAAATLVTVQVRAVGAGIELEVKDNGRGFEPKVAGDTGGMGLITMRERAERLGGTLTIGSALGEGTNVRVIVGTGISNSEHRDCGEAA